MRVRVMVEQEVDAEVSLDDVMAEIAALPEPQRNAETLRLLNLCVSAVKRVPDQQIGEMTPGQRKIVADALRAEVARYEGALQPQTQSG